MIIKKANIKKSIFPFIASIMGGCTQHHLQGMDDKSDATNGSIKKEFKQMQVSENKLIKKKFSGYMVFLPGFTETSTSLKDFKGSLKSYLEEKYNLTVLWIGVYVLHLVKGCLLV